ncbi:hypothetical protein DFH07DRAFT_764001 [Mycena maculata]|uniref:Uncharacterized protein n=1 Tax=Mycena maculata TaxID=230809 RepID=A0AAD7KDN4_9AGAR|nr:hypothetical protein DFH07DRAFT_764001 [Mycena maculata]
MTLKARTGVGISQRGLGRPPKVYSIRGRAAELQRDQASPPAPPPVVIDALEEIPVTGAVAHHGDNPSAVFLDNIHHNLTWCFIATIPTHHMPMWFNDQKHDFNHHYHTPTGSVTIAWFHHPGNSPRDPRAHTLSSEHNRPIPGEDSEETIPVEEQVVLVNDTGASQVTADSLQLDLPSP